MCCDFSRLLSNSPVPQANCLILIFFLPFIASNRPAHRCQSNDLRWILSRLILRKFGLPANNLWSLHVSTLFALNHSHLFIPIFLFASLSIPVFSRHLSGRCKWSSQLFAFEQLVLDCWFDRRRFSSIGRLDTRTVYKGFLLAEPGALVIYFFSWLHTVLFFYPKKPICIPFCKKRWLAVPNKFIFLGNPLAFVLTSGRFAGHPTRLSPGRLPVTDLSADRFNCLHALCPNRCLNVTFFWLISLLRLSSDNYSKFSLYSATASCLKILSLSLTKRLEERSTGQLSYRL